MWICVIGEQCLIDWVKNKEQRGVRARVCEGVHEAERPETALGCWDKSEESGGRAMCEDRVFLAGEYELVLDRCIGYSYRYI